MGIKAELHGKISSSGSNITDTLEDLLTSNVFGLLNYIPIEKGLLPILSQAVNLNGDKFKIPNDVNEAELYFWKAFKNSEPDVFIELRNNKEAVAHIMVEAKYLSGKSGLAVYEAEEDEPLYIAGSDQLEREWNDLKDHSANKQVPYYLLYLTMDWVIPSADIKDSIRAIGDHCRKHIYWLNWQSIHTTFKEIIQKGKSNLSRAEELILTDIVELLKKKGLKEYSGYNLIIANKLVPFHYFNPQFYRNLSTLKSGSIKYFKGVNE